MCYYCYNYDDDRRPDDVDEEEAEYYYQEWLVNQEGLRLRAEEYDAMMAPEEAPEEAPKARQADLDVW